MRTLVIGAAALAAVLLAPSPSLSGTLYGKGALVVRDRITGQPISGATVTLEQPQYASARKQKPVSGNRGVTDTRGYAEAKMIAGGGLDYGIAGTNEIVCGRVHATVEMPGYQSFHGEVGVFYAAFRKEYRPYLFLDEVHLSREGRAEPSAAAFQSFEPQVELQPKWGDFRRSYVVKVRVEVPAVLAHEFKDPLLKIGVMGTSTDPRKPQFLLRDEGKGVDDFRHDGTYTGTVTFPETPLPTLVEQLPVLISAWDQLHALIPREGRWYSWVHTTRTLGSKRKLDVFAAVVKLPAQGVLARTSEEAERVFLDRFPVLSEPGKAIEPPNPYRDLAGSLENPPPPLGWRFTLTTENSGLPGALGH